MGRNDLLIRTFPRVNYIPNCEYSDFLSRIPTVSWNGNVLPVTNRGCCQLTDLVWAMVFLRCSSGFVSISCPSCSATDGVVRNGKSTAGHQRYLCSHRRKTWQLQFTYTASQPGTHQKIIDMAMNGVGCRATARIMGVGLNTIFRHLKLRPQSVTRAYSRTVTSSSARKWTNSGDTSGLNRASAGCSSRV